MSKNLSVSYTYNYLTFLFIEKGIPDTVRSIYLFGSAVRGELKPESDIDLFIDCAQENEQGVRNAAGRAAATFAKSKDFDKWKHFGFTHPFSFHTGPLEEWELKGSIETEGMQVYGKPSIEGYQRAALFTIEPPRQHKTYLRIARALFGRKEKGFASPGIVEQCAGARLGTAVFFVPLGKRKTILDFLAKHKIAYRLQDIAIRS